VRPRTIDRPIAAELHCEKLWHHCLVLHARSEPPFMRYDVHTGIYCIQNTALVSLKPRSLLVVVYRLSDVLRDDHMLAFVAARTD
jgi:hypothetical protein